MNIAIHFIRARSNLILNCSSEKFPIYIRYSVGRGRRAGYKGKREREKSRYRTVIVVIFLRLISWSIFDNGRVGRFVRQYLMACLDIIF